MEGWEWDSLKDISVASSGFNASFFGFGNLGDMAVHGILDEVDQYKYFRNVTLIAPKAMQLKRDSLKVGGDLTNVNYSDTRSHGCELTNLSEL